MYGLPKPKPPVDFLYMFAVVIAATCATSVGVNASFQIITSSIRPSQ
jgi:hypothetical protein